MISKENFVTLIESNRKFFAYVMKLSNEMNIELWENPMVTEYNKVFMNYIKEFFNNEEDIEWVEWFCYDKFYNLPDGKIAHAWDEDGNEICQTAEDLYDYLVKMREINKNGEIYREGFN